MTRTQTDRLYRHTASVEVSPGVYGAAKIEAAITEAAEAVFTPASVVPRGDASSKTLIVSVYRNPSHTFRDAQSAGVIVRMRLGGRAPFVCWSGDPVDVCQAVRATLEAYAGGVRGRA